jgi:hypothetical protein
MPAMKHVGEPGAGEPHARFDEAAGGIWHQSGSHTPHGAGASRRPYRDRGKGLGLERGTNPTGWRADVATCRCTRTARTARPWGSSCGASATEHAFDTCSIEAQHVTIAAARKHQLRERSSEPSSPQLRRTQPRAGPTRGRATSRLGLSSASVAGAVQHRCQATRGAGSGCRSRASQLLRGRCRSGPGADRAPADAWISSFAQVSGSMLGALPFSSKQECERWSPGRDGPTIVGALGSLPRCQ